MPLFPLNTVVFPGVVTPLHIFEERYRALVRELVEIESVFDRVFGIIAIREGYEVGDHGMQSAHRVGTLVQLTEVEAYDDGRFDIEVIGRQRLRVIESDNSGPFLRGDVELLPDTDEPERSRRPRPRSPPSRPTASCSRSCAAARSWPARCRTTRRTSPTRWPAPACSPCPSARQLLEADSARERLGMLRRTLHEEMRAMRALPSLPATEVARTRWSPN